MQGVTTAPGEFLYPRSKWRSPESYFRVISHDEAGAAYATEHLIRLGHRRIAYIGGAAESGSSLLRETGFRRAMTEAGLSVTDVTSGNWDAGETEHITRALLARPDGQKPTAIFCASDSMALVAIRTAQRSGLRVPEDLSVVGYGNLDRTDLVNPPLTTVEQPFYQMGALAVRSLLARTLNHRADGIDAPAEHLLETRLVIRESTASPHMSDTF